MPPAAKRTRIGDDRTELDASHSRQAETEARSDSTPSARDQQLANSTNGYSSGAGAYSGPMWHPKLKFPLATIPHFDDMIASLDDKTVRSLLSSIASSDPTRYSSSMVMDAYSTHVSKIRAKVINFDHYSKSAWRTLNTSYYTKLSSSKQYDASFDAFSEVTGCITAIGDEVKAESSYGTKLNALETIRKIGKTVLLSNGDCLNSEVKKQFGQSETCLEDTMVNILETMTTEECVKAGMNVSEPGKGTLLDKVRWVHAEGEGYCIFEGLDYAIELLDGIGGEEYGEDEDDEDDAHAHVQQQPGRREVITID